MWRTIFPEPSDLIKYPCPSVGSTLSKAIVNKKEARSKAADRQAHWFGSNFAYKLCFDHERDILRLKSIFVKNCGSRPFGDPQEHGNEAG